MGLENGGGSQRNYLSISDGKIAKSVQEGTPNAVKKTNKEGTKTFYELHYPAVAIQAGSSLVFQTLTCQRKFAFLRT